MKSLEILGQVAEKQGVKDLEVLIMSLYKVFAEATPLIAAAPEATVAEKTVASGLGMVLPGLEGFAKGLADLNKDGVIG